MKKMLLWFLFVLPIVSLTMSEDTMAATRSVPNSYSSIQKAINAAQNGDEVIVEPGIYRENIEIIGKYIIVKSSGDAQNTVITPSPGKTPVMIQNVPYRAGGKTEVSGFRITGGYSPDGQGGGITIANNADPIITNNLIEGNQSVMQGGGILIYNHSNPHIKNNTIRNNRAFMFGGGIFVVQNSAPIISENYIQDNATSGASFPNGGASGGGIYLENNDKGGAVAPVVIHNIIGNNSADFAGGGIMIRTGVSPIIEDNDITSNKASYGGGIHIESPNMKARISFNRINDNRAIWSGQFAGSGFGGGISVYGFSRPNISHNSLASNASSKGGGGVVMAEGSQSDLNSNILSSNWSGDNGADGGAIYIAGANAHISNNVFNSNSANHTGGGLAVLGNSSTQVRHNTFFSNTAGHSIGGSAIFIANGQNISANISSNILSTNNKYQIFEDGAKANIDNNVIFNSISGHYYNYNTNGITSIANLNSSSAVNATNNVENDPKFTSTSESNFNITDGSSAISLANEPSAYEDINKYIRPIGASSDAGAFEYNDGTGIKKTPVSRFWSNQYMGHFYTIGDNEKKTLIYQHHPQEWRYEGLAYDAFTIKYHDSQPLYRFWSNQYKGHFYTSEVNERDYIISNYPENTWKFEGVAYHIYTPGSTKKSWNVDRFWSNSYRHHFYTADEGESIFVQNTQSNQWSYEGSRFRVPR